MHKHFSHGHHTREGVEGHKGLLVTDVKPEKRYDWMKWRPVLTLTIFGHTKPNWLVLKLMYNYKTKISMKITNAPLITLFLI